MLLLVLLLLLLLVLVGRVHNAVDYGVYCRIRMYGRIVVHIVIVIIIVVVVVTSGSCLLLLLLLHNLLLLHFQLRLLRNRRVHKVIDKLAMLN